MQEDKLLEELEADWICDIVRNTYQNHEGRKIVLWGKYGVSERIARALEKVYHISVYGYIESNESKVKGSVFFVSDFFAHARKEEYYIVVPLALRPEVVETLRKNGFEKNADYYYFSECVVEQREDYYEDDHGNKIIGKTKIVGGGANRFFGISCNGGHS